MEDAVTMYATEWYAMYAVVEKVIDYKSPALPDYRSVTLERQRREHHAAQAVHLLRAMKKVLKRGADFEACEELLEIWDFMFEECLYQMPPARFERWLGNVAHS